LSNKVESVSVLRVIVEVALVLVFVFHVGGRACGWDFTIIFVVAAASIHFGL
jgi:hypothetical protein